MDKNKNDYYEELLKLFDRDSEDSDNNDVEIDEPEKAKRETNDGNVQSSEILAETFLSFLNFYFCF